MNIAKQEFRLSKPVTSWIELKNENTTRQKFDYSCGSAALSTILKYYYGREISEMDVLNAVLEGRGIDKKMVNELEEEDMSLSFFDLMSYAQSKGFKAVGLALDLESLKKLKMPVILFVKIRKSEHFTVYRGMDDANVYLADPSFGNIKVKIAKFQEMFYQREDLKYPGKLLAILSKDTENEKQINKNFMKIHKGSKNLQEVIRHRMIHAY